MGTLLFWKGLDPKMTFADMKFQVVSSLCFIAAQVTREPALLMYEANVHF